MEQFRYKKLFYSLENIIPKYTKVLKFILFKKINFMLLIFVFHF